MTYAYLPMEIKSREFHSRVEIAQHLLLRNMRVVMGQQWAMFRNIEAMPRGVVLFNTVNDIKARLMGRYKLHNCVVTALDEESLFRTNHLTRTFTEIAADNCDVFFAQNEQQRDAVKQRYPGVSCVMTGNPRVEISRKQHEAGAKALREEYGKFVLINTNFSTINSIWKDADQERIVRSAGLQGDVASKIREWMAMEVINRHEICRLIMELLRDGHKIIIRPHPGEDPAFWQLYERTFPDVRVVNNSDPLAYLLACEFMFHSNCTTGLEAAILGVPCVNVLAEVEKDTARITSLVNPVVHCAHDASIKYLHHRLGEKITPPDLTDKLQEFYPNISQPGAAARIAVEMHRLAPEPTPGSGEYIYHEREDILREKLVIDQPDMVRAIEEIERATGLKNIQLRVMDESLYMLERSQ